MISVDSVKVKKVFGNYGLLSEDFSKNLPNFEAILVENEIFLQNILSENMSLRDEDIHDLMFDVDSKYAILVLNTSMTDGLPITEIESITENLLSQATVRLIHHYSVNSILFFCDTDIKKQIAIRFKFETALEGQSQSLLIYRSAHENHGD